MLNPLHDWTYGHSRTILNAFGAAATIATAIHHYFRRQAGSQRCLLTQIHSDDREMLRRAISRPIDNLAASDDLRQPLSMFQEPERLILDQYMTDASIVIPSQPKLVADLPLSAER
jgi:hypothetical protein